MFVNRRLTEFLGGKPGDYIGKKFGEIHRTNVGGAIHSLAMEVLASEQPIIQRELIPAKRPDRVFRYTFVPVFEDGSDISGVLTIGQDVTEQVQAQAETRASETRFLGIVDIASDALIMLDHDLYVTTFNKGAEQIFGYAAADMIGQPLGILIPESFRATHGSHIAAFERSSQTSRPMAARGEIAGLRKDGTTFPDEASISKLRLGEETVFTVFLRDITESK